MIAARRGDQAAMKRFYTEVATGPAQGGWQVLLDGRAVRTQGGVPQVVPSAALAELLADEWRAQGEEIDPRGFGLRDMADYARDVVAPDRAGALAKLLGYAETDTLCYRADPDTALYQRQLQLWEPLVLAAEERLGVSFERVSGVLYRAQRSETLETLRKALKIHDIFAISGLVTLASLSSSLITALSTLEPDADAAALFTAANAEEDWQAELWGWDWMAEDNRADRAKTFALAVDFIRAAKPVS